MKKEIKQKAIELLTQLNVYFPYVKAFKDREDICFFEQYGSYWLDQEPEIYKKVKEIESEYKLTIYAITHEFFDFGECWSCLYIPNEYPEEWDGLLTPSRDPRKVYVQAYVWNKDRDECSEFGTVEISCFAGGLRRIL